MLFKYVSYLFTMFIRQVTSMSIKEIAKLSGVSISTVSRILNNPDYRCADPTVRDRVWKAAIETNYVPNTAARNLKMGNINHEKTHFIDVLMTRTGNAGADPFFSELLKNIESEIHRHACILSQIWYETVFSDDRRAARTDLSAKIEGLYTSSKGEHDGLIIIGKCVPEAIHLWKKLYRNIVSINRNSTNYEIDEVLCDGRKIARTAVDYLYELGHRKIGYIGETVNETRYQGYVDTLSAHHLIIDPNMIVETHQTETGGFRAMEKLMGRENGPTGIYCGNDITALGALRYLKSRRALPYMPSIIGSDDIEEAQESDPMLTTVRLPKREMGMFAVALLIDRIKGEHESITRMELEGKLIVRSSCMAPEDGIWCDYII